MNTRQPPTLARKRIVATALAFSLTALVVVACVGQIPNSTALENEYAYLSPIPESTLWAYRLDQPVNNRLDAVLSARIGLRSTRLRSFEEPRVLFAERASVRDAWKSLAISDSAYWSESDPATTLVWIVVFEGVWQVEPPDPEHTVTPPAPAPGCVYALLSDEVGGPSAYGGVECEELSTPTPK